MEGNGTNDEEKLASLGRMQRLFNRGHLEENRYVAYLKGIGCEVWTHDEKGNQFRMSAIGGHYGGSIDCVIKLPPRYEIPDPVLGEFKTNYTKTFDELLDKGVAVCKPQHFIQMSSYGNEYKLKYGIYFNTNKNDDDMHIEVIELNHGMAETFKSKAERIIRSQDPPPRYSETPTDRKCVYCDFKKVCHQGAKPEVNCRSCKFSNPIPGGEWFCNSHNAQIPREAVPLACPNYVSLING